MGEKIIINGVEASTRISHTRFQIKKSHARQVSPRLNNLKSSLRVPCIGFNTTIGSIKPYDLSYHNRACSNAKNAHFHVENPLDVLLEYFE